MKIIKAKNLMTFDCEDGMRPYILDINTAIMYGRNGHPLKHVPSELWDYFKGLYWADRFNPNWVIRLFACRSNYPANKRDELLSQASLMRFFDKLTSLKYVYNYSIYQNELDYLLENEKDFIKAISENPKLSIKEFVNSHSCKKCLQSFGIKEETFSNKEFEYISTTWAACRACPNTRSIIVKYFDYFCYYVKQGFAVLKGYFSLSEYALKYFTMCEALHLSPEKTIFTKTFANVLSLWEERKEEWYTQRLLNYAQEMKEKLFFEDENYTIIIPSSSIDFHEEAVNQNNCVERIYKERVMEGKTNIVFIRKKNNLEHSYITCEVSNSGNIVQFLRSCNRRVMDKQDLAFKAQYQQFLKTTWGR